MSDGSGLAQGLEWKGAPSLRPCFCCDNVCSLDSDLASRGRDQIEIDACRRDSFRLKSQSVLFGQVDDILNAIDGVKRGERGSITRLKELGMAFGSNVTEHGLLTMPALRRSGMHPVDMVRYDWVHNLLQRGVFQVEVALFFESTGIDDVTGQYNRFSSLEWNVHPELASSFRKLSEICMSHDVRGLDRPLAAQVIDWLLQNLSLLRSDTAGRTGFARIFLDCVLQSHWSILRCQVLAPSFRFSHVTPPCDHNSSAEYQAALGEPHASASPRIWARPRHTQAPLGRPRRRRFRGGRRHGRLPCGGEVACSSQRSCAPGGQHQGHRGCHLYQDFCSSC